MHLLVGCAFKSLQKSIMAIGVAQTESTSFYSSSFYLMISNFSIFIFHLFYNIYIQYIWLNLEKLCAWEVKLEVFGNAIKIIMSYSELTWQLMFVTINWQKPYHVMFKTLFEMKILSFFDHKVAI